MKKHALLKAGAATAVIALTVAAPAYAQDADVTTDSTAEAEEPGQGIVVTGTRLRSPNLESASPVTVVTAEEFALTGTTRVEDLINSLPQVFAGQGGNVSNGSTGTATLDLRGLGSERTLVLVNGRRMAPGTPSTSSPDINMIPAALIERVDVLTGGASSVYGADAVAGVVNFVLDTDFEGFKVNLNYGTFNHNNRASADVRGANDARRFGYPTGMVTDGGTFDGTLAFGSSFDDGRGRVTAYLGYRKIDPVLQARRDYSACSLSANTAAATTTLGRQYNCGGSATSATGTVFYNEGFGADFTSTLAQFGPNRTLLGGTTPFNFGPLNYFQRPDERYTAGLFADYEISSAIKPYMEFMFMDDRTVAQIAPSGNFGNTLSINCDNPLLGAGQRAALCNNANLLVSPLPSNAFIVTGNVAAENAARVARGLGEPLLPTTPFNFVNQIDGTSYNRGFAQILRRNVEGGGRQDDLQHVSYRAVIGVKGDLSPAWSYDAFYQYGRNNYAQTYLNDFSVTRLGRAIDVVAGPGGTPVCRSTLDGTDPNCVPWDIFSPGTVTPSAAATAYLATPGFSRGVVSQQVANAFLSGSLGEYGLKTPWADQGVDVVFGVEYRKESLEFNSDSAFSTGDLAGQGAATLPVSGSFNVKEFFTEVRIPIAQDSWVYDFTVTGGYRYSDYSTGVNTDTFKIEGEFAPIRDFRIRGGFNRAVRAPTVQDLFAPNLVALDGSSDPCAGFVLTAANTGCLAQGLSVGQFVAPNPADQYNGFVGGNANLQPEIADTYTAGVVITPTFLPGFTASVDYFNIDIAQAIGGIGSDTILAACTATADPFFCGLINRDPTGSLWRSAGGFTTNVTQNIGGFKTSGIDGQVNYNTEIGDLGTLTFNFLGTYLDKLVTDTGVTIPGLDQTFDCVGLYGNVCGSPNPEWRHQARVGFNFRNGIGASVRWRYFDGVGLDSVSTNTNLSNTGGTGPSPGGVARPGAAGFDAVNYFDLTFTFDAGDNFNFVLGANNVLDKAPPTTGSQACPAGPCNGNVFAQTYDALGRYLFAGVTLDF
ncbi:outer membrane receptor protein involved in Fe transport [Erythromicrobium ramosum]|uniref:Outer membrane receptor protein involved in Fe transport n=1 Tax=Erythrobacter ramosus TaxID=35811 RepID=A0A6I4UQT4_9SPHN|nr:TonB-dependent receptor [Erythrobacter ramosus]MBB3776761.1 outer membrane receptor protein involved in Fe transport [Erythrobacter ramosus]MXP39615.1 TonB-dependent receptor [Erythrobacter ramosus]